MIFCESLKSFIKTELVPEQSQDYRMPEQLILKALIQNSSGRKTLHIEAI